jgi:hypothetical protein
MNIDDWIEDDCLLPDPRFDGLWESVIVDEGIKSRLVNQALLALTIRPRCISR